MKEQVNNKRERLATEKPVRRIAVFGSTGSIGTQALEVMAASPDLFSVEILTANHNDELLIAEFDLDMIEEVRNVWQFFRDRRPETYGKIVEL